MQPVRLPPFTPAPNTLRLASQAAAVQNGSGRPPASGKTMKGALPPSSRDTRFTVPAAACTSMVQAHVDEG